MVTLNDILSGLTDLDLLVDEKKNFLHVLKKLICAQQQVYADQFLLAQKNLWYNRCIALHGPVCTYSQKAHD